MRSRRLVRAVPAGLLAVALLAACGDETSSDTEASKAADSSPTLNSRTLGSTALDITQATTAMLADANLPGFDNMGPQVPDESDAPLPADESTGAATGEPTDEATSTGCETEESFEERFDRGGLARTRTDVGYIYADESRLLIITSLVTSFDDEEQAGSSFDAVVTDFQSCTHYEDTDAETGESTVIDVENNADTATEDVDDQINMLGNGLWTLPESDEVPMGFGLSLARVDNNVTLTQVISLGVADDRDLLAPYTEIAVDRLVAVMNGETPEDVAGPAPTPVPASRLPLPLTSNPADAYGRYFDLDPRFALPN